MKPEAVLFGLDGTLLLMNQNAFTKGHYKLLVKKLYPHDYEPYVFFTEEGCVKDR